MSIRHLFFLLLLSLFQGVKTPTTCLFRSSVFLFRASGDRHMNTGSVGYESGFRWLLRDKAEEPAWHLVAPSGKHAATVFLHHTYGGHVWFVWDEYGEGGENSIEPTIKAAMIVAESAVLRWGKHPISAQNVIGLGEASQAHQVRHPEKTHVRS